MKRLLLPILLIILFIPFCVKAKSHLEVGDYIYMVPDLDTYDDTYGYGDSIGDKVGMLTIVNHPQYRVF